MTINLTRISNGFNRFGDDFFKFLAAVENGGQVPSSQTLLEEHRAGNVERAMPIPPVAATPTFSAEKIEVSEIVPAVAEDGSITLEARKGQGVSEIAFPENIIFDDDVHGWSDEVDPNLLEETPDPDKPDSAAYTKLFTDAN